MLQELMAGWLGLEPGNYVQISDSFHWYENQSARLGIDRDVVPAPNTDRFGHSMDTCLKAFSVLADRMDQIVRSRTTGTMPSQMEPTLPQPFENMFVLIAADDARRYGDVSLARSLAEQCSNPALLQLWERWLEHVTLHSDPARRDQPR
jgi:hypothetical protein